MSLYTEPKKIYLAGPDVFRQNATEHLNNLKNECSNYGFIGLSPFDSEASADATATQIFNANIKLLNECDIVIANLDTFRGPNVDDGTAFEIGYAFALGKLILGYTPWKDKTLKTLMDAYHRHDKYPIVEDFGYCRNLMIVDSINKSGGYIFHTFEDCLELIFSLLNPPY